MKETSPVHYPAHPAGPYYVPGHMQTPPKSRASDEAASSLGLTVIRGSVGGAAILAGMVAAFWLVRFVLSLAGSATEGMLLGFVAVAAAMALGGLPVAGAVLSRNYPHEARLAYRCWIGIVIVAVCGVVMVTARGGARPPAVDVERPAFMPSVVWEYSDHCRRPENRYQAQVCEDIGGLRAVATAPSQGAGQRLLVALIGIGSIILAGFLGRLAVLSMSESRRLIGAEAQPLDLPPGGPIIDAIAADDMPMSPMQIFDMWYQARVVLEHGASVSASVVYEDYKATCAGNGYPAWTQTKFGSMLGSKMANSGGRIQKSKRTGVPHYVGLRLIGETAPLGVQPDDFAAVPSRS